jgi:taurine--2-oxoglutarate transaminase
LVQGKDCYVEDASGKKYLDFMSGTYNVALGHQNEEIIASMREQLDNIVTYSSEFAYIPTVLLAQKLLEKLPAKYAKMSLQCNGTDAVEAAFMIVRQISGKRCIISEWLSFHGSSSETLCSGGFIGNGHPPNVIGHMHVFPCYCYRCPFSKDEYPECNLGCAHFLEKTIESAGANQIAAVLVEPILGSIVNDPPTEYLKALKEICQKHSIFLIADEVLTGFGRTGKLFCFEHSGILPDIIIAGKALTSGYAPLSATIISGEIAEFYENKPFEYGLTYGGNPLSCSAALATLKYFDEHNVIENAKEIGLYLKERLLEMQSDHPCIGQIRGRGSLIGIELVRNRSTKQPFTDNFVSREDVGAYLVRTEALKRGLIVDKGLSDNVILAPPLIVTREECDIALGILDNVLTTVDSQIKTV